MNLSSETYNLLLIILIPLVLFPIYLLVAKRFGIKDNPGGRSSHTQRTITGSGIVFTISLLLVNLFLGTSLPISFMLGLSAIVLISFVDDIVFIKHSYRFVFQLLSVVLLVSTIPMSEANTFSDKFPIWIAGVIFGVCVLNGFNFMDGINGLLASTSFIILLSLAYLNENLIDANGKVIQFVNPYVIYSLIASTIIFLFLNLRGKALSFMGDAGSIGIAFTTFYLVFLLVSQTGNTIYFLLFSVLGIDSGLTVVYKLILKENIFIPHRDFLFKKLVHIGKFGHVRIAIIYALIQGVINSAIIFIPFNKGVYTQISIIFIMISVQIAAFIFVRNRYTKSRIIRIFAEKQLAKDSERRHTENLRDLNKL